MFAAQFLTLNLASSYIFIPGVHSRLATHVPIPNTIDKEPHDDGTAQQSAGE